MMLLIAKILGGYLLGSVSGSLLLGRLRGVDIRRLGSGNAGGTNAFRTQGALFALAVVTIDIGKGALAAWLGGLGPDSAFLHVWHAPATAAAAVVGHCHPVWHGFRGGKGAATAVGAVAVLMPAMLLPMLVLWILVLTLTGWVSLATVLAALALAGLTVAWFAAWPLRAFALFVAGLVVFAHRSNLVRLRRGDEHRFERARLFHRLLRRA